MYSSLTTIKHKGDIRKKGTVSWENFASSQTQQVNGTACMYRQRMLASAQVWGSRVTVQHRTACHAMSNGLKVQPLSDCPHFHRETT